MNHAFEAQEGRRSPHPSLCRAWKSRCCELKPAEDGQEKAQRLQKDRLNFYVKDILVWIIGCLFVVLTGLYCF